MSVFGKYARYYDILYRDKDYAGETIYIQRLIKKHFPEAKRLLELGCGTGRHAELLFKGGFDIIGIDSSAEMLSLAASRTVSGQGNKSSGLSFLHEDIRDFHLNRKFDVIVAFFHVISYQTSNDDLKRVFKIVQEHLKPGGGFIFDCWYGPAVLTDRPGMREVRLEDDRIEVIRKAEPEMHPNENIVDVNYRILIRDKRTEEIEEIKETHKMRYLFRPELEWMLSDIGMGIIACEEWMTGKPPGFDTWGVCFVGQI